MVRLLVVGMTCLLALIQESQANSWFSVEGYNCSGSRPLHDAIQTYTGFHLNIQSGSSGNVYAVLSGKEALGYLEKETVVGSATLDQESAKTLSHIFFTQANDTKVPSWVGLNSSVLTGLLLPSRFGADVASDFTFNLFFTSIDQYANSIRDIGLFIAPGGVLKSEVSVRQRASDGNLFIVASDVYSVPLGTSTRSFSVFACIYPLNVETDQFTTSGPLNNKVMRRIDAQSWRTWDVDTKRYSGDPYTFLFESGGAYYFERDGDLHKLSLTGTGWWRQLAEERPNGPWKAYYKASVPY